MPWRGRWEEVCVCVLEKAVSAELSTLTLGSQHSTPSTAVSGCCCCSCCSIIIVVDLLLLLLLDLQVFLFHYCFSYHDIFSPFFIPLI